MRLKLDSLVLFWFPVPATRGSFNRGLSCGVTHLNNRQSVLTAKAPELAADRAAPLLGPPVPRSSSPVSPWSPPGMMPADTAMTSIVQRIARQALLTFRSPGGRSFPEQHGKLRSLVAEVRAADLQLVPRRAEDGHGPGPGAPPHQPPVTYMHICETEAFSMGVFLLRGGACIPLHDHPGMHGVLKVLYGKVRISCFDRPEPAAAPGDAGGAAGGGAPRLPPPLQAPAPRRSVLRSSAVYTETSPPCVLGPDRDNLHRIDAVDGPTAFMDILAPPYDPDDGRDCHYYRVVSGPEGLGPEPREVWLQEVAQPPDFRCGGEPYPGPEVRL